MRVPLEWLREYVDYGRRSPEEVAELFSSSGTEVEQVMRPVVDPDVVVSEILEVRPHPNADRLQLVRVAVGRRRYEVVCGAPNVAVGQKVPFAAPGATIQGQILQAATIRGVKSDGMLLSARELGISDDHGGILVLPADAVTGQSVDEVLGHQGTVIELARIAPNRPDKFGLIGLARELAATLSVRTDSSAKLKLPRVNLTEEGPKTGDQISVEVAHPADCPAYLARVVEFDPSLASPEWLVRRLEEAGSRSAGLAVDVTNYVMLETAQPLHAFDADLVRGRIRVRRAKKGERITTLDGVDRPLSPEILVIADDEGPIAVAGVMGGSRTEVSPQTGRIILESANFDKTVVRKGAQALGLRTEASTRFEKGLPISFARVALDRAAQLLVEHGSGVVSRGVAGIPPKAERPYRVVLEDEVASLGGLELPAASQAKALRAVGCEVTHPTGSTGSRQAGSGQGGRLTVTVPDWRADLRLPEDLVEEVLRLVGYDRIPSRLPAGAPRELSDPVLNLRRRIQEILTAVGAYEVKTYAFVSAQMLERLGLEPAKHLRLENPRSPEQAYLRSELVSRLLEVLATNRAYHDRRPLVWELAHVFRKVSGPKRVEEREEVTVVGGGEEALREVRGALDLLAKRLHLHDSLEVKPQDSAGSWWHPGRVGEVRLGGEAVGMIGELHPTIPPRWKLRGRVAVIRLDWERLRGVVSRAEAEYRAIPRFPVTRRDISFDVAADIFAAEITKVAAAEENVLETRYRADREAPGLKAGRKQVVLTLQITAQDRTLSDTEIQAVEDRVKKSLKKRFSASFHD